MNEHDPQATSIHVRAAREGDEASLAWLIDRFGPLLLTQARYRIGQARLPDLEPDDLVKETWRIALPRLKSIRERDGRVAPVLLSFLSTTLLQLANNHIRKTIRRGEQQLAPEEAANSKIDPVRNLLMDEQKNLVLRCIEALDEKDRAIVVLRIIEGLGNNDCAQLLGDSPNACSLRFNRVLSRLRTELPRSVFQELGDEG